MFYPHALTCSLLPGNKSLLCSKCFPPVSPDTCSSLLINARARNRCTRNLDDPKPVKHPGYPRTGAPRSKNFRGHRAERGSESGRQVDWVTMAFLWGVFSGTFSLIDAPSTPQNPMLHGNIFALYAWGFRPINGRKCFQSVVDCSRHEQDVPVKRAVMHLTHAGELWRFNSACGEIEENKTHARLLRVYFENNSEKLVLKWKRRNWRRHTVRLWAIFLSFIFFLVGS